jgi:hypothetical protein
MMSKWDDAVTHFQDALDHNTKMGARAWLAHTRYDYGQMLRGRGDPGDYEHSCELFNLASSAAREQGMNALAERTNGALKVTS